MSASPQNTPDKPGIRIFIDNYLKLIKIVGLDALLILVPKIVFLSYKCVVNMDKYCQVLHYLTPQDPSEQEKWRVVLW